MLTIIIGVVGLLCSVLLAFIAYVQWRENHSDRKGSKLNLTVKAIVEDQLRPVNKTISDNTARLTQGSERIGRVEDALKEMASTQRQTADSVSQMSVKVDMYWHTLEALAMNSAKGLHQPDPRRSRVDHLLEAFMEGTLTAEERIELKKILVKIRNYEPSSPPLEFPIQPGEQTYAAILLSTMDLVDPLKMAAMGHAAHRSVAHKEKNEDA